jgi:hypothetical protein
MPPLTSADLTTACELILECYDRPTLEQLIRDRFDLRLEWVVRDAGLAEQVTELLKFAGRHRLTGRLLKEAADYPPPRLKLRPLAEKYPPDPDEAARPAAALIGEAIGAFEEIPVLLKESDVRARFTPYTAAYQDAANHIDLLRRYKGLHDCLCVIQLKYPEISRAAKDLAEDPREAGSLNSYADGLEAAMAGDDKTPGVHQLLEKLPNQGPELTWLGKLQRAVIQLREAANRHDPKPAEEAIHDLSQILQSNPIRIQGIILHQFEVVPLPSLIFSLRAIQDTPVALPVRKRLDDGLTALEAVHLKLIFSVAEHTAWQNLDNSLRLALESWYELLAVKRRRAAERNLVPVGAGVVQIEEDDSQSVYANRLLEDWRDVFKKFDDVRARAAPGRRLDPLAKYAEAIGPEPTARDFGAVFDSFEPFARLALHRFIEVDKGLLALADELTDIGGPLQAILEVVRR